MNKQELATITAEVEKVILRPVYIASGENLVIVNKNVQFGCLYDIDISALPDGVNYAIGDKKESMTLYPCIVLYKGDKPVFDGITYRIPFHEYTDASGEPFMIRLELAEAQKYFNKELTLTNVQTEIKLK